MSGFSQKFRDELIVGFGAILISLSVFLFVWNTAGLAGLTWGGNDFIEYDILAKNVLAGHGFSLRDAPPHEPSALRTPGYPLFLALSYAVSGNTVIASLMQILLLAGFGIIGFRILLLMGLRRAYALGGALLAVIEPDVLSMSLYLISDMLFVFLLSLSLFFYLKFLSEDSIYFFLWGSAAAGLGALVRPVGILVFLFFAIVFFFKKGIRRELLYSFLAFMIFIFPWSARNFLIFGTWRLSSADTYNLYTVAAPQIISFRDNLSYAEARELLLQKFISAAEFQPLPPVDNIGYHPARAEFLLADNFEYEEWMKKETKSIFWSSPASFLKLVSLGTLEYLTQVNWLTPLEHWNILHPSYRPQKSFQQVFFEDGPGSMLTEIWSRFSCGTSCVLAFGLNGLGRIFWLAVIFFSGWGFFNEFRARKERRLPLFLVAFFIFLYSAVHIFFTGVLVQPRYRMPLVPILVGFSLSGMVTFWSFLRLKLKAHRP